MARIQPSSMHARDFHSYDPWDVALGDCEREDRGHIGENQARYRKLQHADGGTYRSRERERGWHEVPIRSSSEQPFRLPEKEKEGQLWRSMIAFSLGFVDIELWVERLTAITKYEAEYRYLLERRKNENRNYPKQNRRYDY